MERTERKNADAQKKLEQILNRHVVSLCYVFNSRQVQSQFSGLWGTAGRRDPSNPTAAVATKVKGERETEDDRYSVIQMTSIFIHDIKIIWKIK